jgi:hypothetical protein
VRLIEEWWSLLSIDTVDEMLLLLLVTLCHCAAAVVAC